MGTYSLKRNDTWLYIAFLLIPILNIYSFGVGNLALVVCVIVILYGLFEKSVLKKNRLFLFLSLLIVLHESIFYVYFDGAEYPSWLNTIFGMIIFILTITTFANLLRLEKLYRWWKIIGWIFMIGLAYHSILYYGFHKNVDIIKIPFLPITTNAAFEKILTIEYIRPRSFFTEPSHYTSFMLPLLFLNLLYKDYKYAWFNVISMFLSTSTLGIVISSFFLVMFNFRNTSIQKKLLFMVVALIGYYCFLNLEIFEYARKKILVSNGEDASSNLRLFFTYNVWIDLPYSMKLFGIDAPTIGDFLMKNSKYVPSGLIWVLYDESSINYSSSIWNIAVKYGLFIWGVYLFFYYKLVRGSFNSPILFYAISLIIAIFVQSCFLNSIFMTQIVLMFILLKNKKEINERFYSNNIVCK